MKKRVECYICGHKTARAHDLIGHIKRRHSLTDSGEVRTPSHGKSEVRRAEKRSCTSTPDARISKLKGYHIPKVKTTPISSPPVPTKAMLKDMPEIVISTAKTPPMISILPPRSPKASPPLLEIPDSPLHEPISEPPALPPPPPSTLPYPASRPTDGDPQATTEAGDPPPTPPRKEPSTDQPPLPPDSTEMLTPPSQCYIPSMSTTTTWPLSSPLMNLVSSPRILGILKTIEDSSFSAPDVDVNNNKETAMATENLVNIMNDDTVKVTDVIKEECVIDNKTEPVYEVIDSPPAEPQRAEFVGSATVEGDTFRINIEGSARNLCKSQ